MKKILLISVGLLTLALYYSVIIKRQTTTVPQLSNGNDTSTKAQHKRQREPIDFSSTPSNIYEAVCVLGNPVMVSGWSLNSETRFIFFEGPFKTQTHENETSKVSPYMYYSIDNINSEKRNTGLLVDSLEEYKKNEKPNELKSFMLTKLDNVPHTLPKLVEKLGQWDFELSKKNPTRRRLIYERKFCIGTSLVEGAYFDITDNSVVKAKGLKTKEKLLRIKNNIRLFKPDKKPRLYIDNTPEEGSPEDIVIKLVLLREAGKQTEAMMLLSDECNDEWRRNNITSQSKTGVNIKLNSLTYQATEYTYDSASLTIKYYLENGSLLTWGHKVIREDGTWRVVH